MTNLRWRIYKIIQPVNQLDTASIVFDWFIIIIIFINMLLVILETFNGVARDIRNALLIIDYFSVAVFTIEYIVRFWTSDFMYPDIKPAKARIKYMFSFMAVIDLLAILPFYLPFIFPLDLRVLRMVRLLRLLRLLKVNRYTQALSSVGNVIKRKSAQLISSTFVVLIMMVMVSILMYNIEYEAQPEVFQNAFSGLWWSISTLTTVGYGDIYPITPVGKILGALIALLGIGLVAVPTGIISAGFMENISNDKEDKHFCPYCGKKID